MDSMIRERNGVEEIWYSEEYMLRQIENAHTAGIIKGIHVEFHALIPMDGRMVDDLTSEFLRRVDEEYKKHLNIRK